MKAFVYTITAAVLIIVISPLLKSLALPFAQTPSPSLPAPSFRAIQLHYYEMTDAQWQQYSGDLIGMVATDWKGKVLDVRGNPSEGYELWLSMDPKFEDYELQIVRFPVEDDTALSLQRDLWVIFSGTIKDVNNSTRGGPDIQLANAVISERRGYR